MTRVPRFVFSIEFSVGMLVLLAMIVIGAINPSFWQLQNIFSLLRSNVVIGVMALGVLAVLICGGIDVSFTAVAALGAYAALRLGYVYASTSALVPLVIGAAIGGGLGCVNALLIHYIKIIPLIATLGTGSIVRGLLLGAIGAKIVNVDKMPPGLMDAGGVQLFTVTGADGSKVGLPAVFLAYVAIAVLMHLFLTRTMAGRSLFAVGGDPEAASRIGFDVGYARLIAYGLAGALAGLAGVTHAALNWVGEPRAFDNMTLDVLAAVILGGASIFGGRGSVIGTMIGVFMLVLISNSLIVLGIPTTWQRVLLGVVIIVVTGVTCVRRVQE
jgi:simple sugar transport system permease protein